MITVPICNRIAIDNCTKGADWQSHFEDTINTVYTYEMPYNSHPRSEDQALTP